jgi:hypothetical protein
VEGTIMTLAVLDPTGNLNDIFSMESDVKRICVLLIDPAVKSALQIQDSSTVRGSLLRSSSHNTVSVVVID